MQTTCWKVLIYVRKASYWTASQDVYIFPLKEFKTNYGYIIFTNFCLLIIIVKMILNENRYWQKTKQHVTKGWNLHTQCVTYMKLGNNS